MGWKFWKNDERPQDAVTTTAPRVQDDVPFQLRVEDVFSITGRGTVVTGRVLAGVIRVNDSVGVQRGGAEVLRTVVSGVEMFRRTTDQAVAGDNVGLLLKDVDKSDVQQGDVLTP
ncbi:EF-Tu/IF-2/RF-3 family GTPase [Kribbella italica]|uniref:Elongation factor Tu n=1 Tax=Kribbella italica TaxID=1540520 RepID=A0A7W9J2J9_9ACTN|nr:EF-Tu/IF-2/RF-3 family GTPase [Kribbella italica]MBB5833713.1 translation elongation factor EF-Tu-like GTPase [Kribbella italica]